ncbi:MAG: hypothetical protein ABJP45_11660 [Cyclobacteriaceae bacterium]
MESISMMGNMIYNNWDLQYHHAILSPWLGFSSKGTIMRKRPHPLNDHLIENIPSKVKLLKRKSAQGFPMNMFYKEGNGIKTLLKNTGRLTDFKGVFLVKGRDGLFLAFSSKNVLKEIQKLARCYRKKDEDLLIKIADHFGFLTALAGQEYLRSMEVTWLEVTSEAERLLLTRTLNRSTFLSTS